MKPLRPVGLLLCLLLAIGAAHGQGVGSSGSIYGTVTDPGGGAVPKATVVAVETARGLQYTATTDSNGEYRLAGLPPATYDLTVKMAGFGTEVRKGVVLTVGATLVADFQLKIAATAEVVEVTAELPVVETQRGSQANTLTEQYITDLPIDRRDYLTFTLLMPGVSDSTRMASDTDFRVKQTPQSGLSFYGSNGRGNSVTVDGGEVNDDAGGVRLTVSQEAVQEFQINRSNYNAELGGAGGASINIVLKSGSNQVRGSLYGFFRNDAMDAADPFAFSQALQPGDVFNPANPDLRGQPVKNALSRQQYGGTIGFPIKKDKTFLFAAFEGLRQDAENAVPLLTNTNIFRTQSDPGNNQAAILIGPDGLANLPGNPTVPCLSGPIGAAVAASLGLPAPNPTTNLPAATCAAVLNGALTLNPAANPRSAFLVNQFENNGGLFPYKTRLYFASGRFDHRFNESNQLSVTYHFGHDREESPDVQSLTGFSRGSSVHTYDHTIQAAWYHLFSPTTQNEARAQWGYNNFDVIPNEPGEVGLDIPGFANLGTNIFLPSLTITRRTEVADNMTLIRGHHTMKFGGYFLHRGNHTESHTFFPGRFVFGSLPGNLLSPCLLTPAACLLGPAPLQDCGFGHTPPAGTVCPAVINSLQSAAFGLPQFYQQGFDNPVYNYPRPFAAGFWQDSWTIWPNFTLNFGLRYEIDVQHGPLNTDKNNVAPRVSFAWDPFNNHKTVIRGGYGIFYSQIYGQIPDVVQTLGLVDGFRQIAQVFVPLTGAPGNPSLTSAVIFQTLFAQGKIQCTTPAPGFDACITPADLTQFGITITHTGPVPPLTVLFSGQPGYQNPYAQQAEFGIEREIGKGLSVSANYIYVHTIGLPVAIDINNFKILDLPLASQFAPAGPAGIPIRQWGSSNPNCAGANVVNCFVNPLLLQNNQYSSLGSALYHGGILEIRKRMSNHFTFLGNYTYSKAIDTTTDFNSDFGPTDQTNLAGERGLSTFDQRHKVVVAAVFESPWKNLILSGFQLNPIVRYNSAHPFNLLAGTNVNNDRHSTNDRPPGAGRNTGIGPNAVVFDMRLSRFFKLGERASAQFVAEGFNIFNRTNFGSVNNVVGVIAPPFDLSGLTSRGPSQPQGFTSALAKRVIQLGVKLNF
jgi:hypothetical protein